MDVGKSSHHPAVTVTTEAAARSERIEILEWLWEKHGPIYWRVYHRAKEAKNEAVVEWFENKFAVL